MIIELHRIITAPPMHPDFGALSLEHEISNGCLKALEVPTRPAISIPAPSIPSVASDPSSIDIRSGRRILPSVG